MKYLITVLFLFSTSLAQTGDTVDVHSGWNNIGALQETVVMQIVTIPPDIIVSNFYAFAPEEGYYAEDTLKRGIGYWVRVNQNGKIVFGASSGFTCGINQVEYAGKTYHTVLIGSQCWLKENLDVGIMILGQNNSSNNGVIEKYCYFNVPDYCNYFGGFYQWDEAMKYSVIPGDQGICPNGWHIPTLSDFQTLKTSVGGDGNSLKLIGQGVDSGAGTNTTGFSAFLAGIRNPDGSFHNSDMYAYFWSSSQSSNYAYEMNLNYQNSNIHLDPYIKSYGFNIRCVKY